MGTRACPALPAINLSGSLLILRRHVNISQRRPSTVEHGSGVSLGSTDDFLRHFSPTNAYISAFHHPYDQMRHEIRSHSQRRL